MRIHKLSIVTSLLFTIQSSLWIVLLSSQNSDAFVIVTPLIVFQKKTSYEAKRDQRHPLTHIPTTVYSPLRKKNIRTTPSTTTTNLGMQGLSTSSLTVPNVAAMSGKFLPMVQSFPSSSIQAAISSCPGDVLLLIVLGIISKVEYISRDLTPTKWRDVWTSVALTVQQGAYLWIISILDVVVGTVLRKALHGRVLSMVFLGLWWIPSRYTVAVALRPNLSDLNQPLKENTRRLMKRVMTVAVTAGGILGIQYGLGLNVSKAMSILLPIIALFVRT